MITDYLRLSIPVKDSDFDSMYPPEIRKLSKRHFTPIEVAMKAAELLTTKPKQKILDIGSGTGKFCFVASSCTSAHYTGVDYRKRFVELCGKLAVKYRFKNVSFIHSDVKEINLRDYDGFYFFNSFWEHADQTAKLDNTIETSSSKFNDYSEYLKKEFDKLPEGTRIVTYHANVSQLPNSYRLVSMHFNRLLKCWEKTSDPIAKLI